MSEEQWRPVVGYEGLYEISDQGRVRSLYGKGCIRKPHVRNGYLYVPLWKDQKGTHAYVHRMVAEAFCERREGQDLVRHLDDVKLNNFPSNLAWGTLSENAQDALRNGRNPFANRTHCPQGHPYDEANTIVRPNGRGRTCRACTYQRNREVLERKKGTSGCTEAGCTDPLLARGMCSRHYQAARKRSRVAA